MSDILDDLRSYARRLHTAKASPADVDHGTVFVPGSACGFTNIWSASYDEAAEIRSARTGWLLPHRRRFVVVSDLSFAISTRWSCREARPWVRSGQVSRRKPDARISQPITRSASPWS